MKEIIAEFARNETIRQLSAAEIRAGRERERADEVAQRGDERRPSGAVEHRAQRYRGKAESDFHKRGVEREHPREQHIRCEQYRRDGELTCSYLHYYNITFP